MNPDDIKNAFDEVTKGMLNFSNSMSSVGYGFSSILKQVKEIEKHRYCKENGYLSIEEIEECNL